MVSVTTVDINRAVAGYFGISVEIMLSRSSRRKHAHPRMVAMTLAREICGLSFPMIGQRFGGRDHTTVINAVRIVGEIKSLRSSADEIKAKLCGQQCGLPWRKRMKLELQAARAIGEALQYLGEAIL